MDGRELRAKFREGLVCPTAGMLDGYVQANMIALPRSYAFDFLLFAQRNPKACPVLDVLEEGNFSSSLALNSDIRRDIPKYFIFKDGKKWGEVLDGRDFYARHEDLVSFLIGCSFTFEAALMMAGIEIRHITEGCNVPMYKSNIKCEEAGKLKGNMVVSMRPIKGARVADAARITSRFPMVHGGPIHVGSPADIGITDINAPDFGDAVRIDEGELPVFWACGVTPQVAVMSSGVPYAISHAPGHMFITDIKNSAYEI